MFFARAPSVQKLGKTEYITGEYRKIPGGR